MNCIRSDHQPYFQSFPKPPHVLHNLQRTSHFTPCFFLFYKIRRILSLFDSAHDPRIVHKHCTRKQSNFCWAVLVSERICWTRISSLIFDQIVLGSERYSFLSQHRSLQPTGPPAQGPSQQHTHARLTEPFEAIRQEFDVLASELNMSRSQRDDYEAKCRFHLTF
jgi:hypothetical protein